MSNLVLSQNQHGDLRAMEVLPTGIPRIPQTHSKKAKP